jgi:hypothetical protein
LGGLLLTCGVVAVLISLLPSPRAQREDDIQPGAAPVLPVPPAIRLTPRVRRQVDRTVDEFVRTAVLRRDLERSWRLASPRMRASSSHAQWLRGELPVFPFPADPKRTVWELDFADAYEVALNVTLVPRRGEREGPQVFGVSLEPVGSGERRRFLVGAWYPRGGLSAPVDTAATPPTPPTPQELAAARRSTEGQIDRIWWLVPAGMLALIVIGPLAYFGLGRVRAGLRRRAS